MKIQERVVRTVYFEGELARIMVRKNLNAQQVSDKSGLSLAAIQGIVDGTISVSLEWGTKLAVALGVQFSELFGNVFD